MKKSMTLAARQQIAENVLIKLKAAYPDADCTLHFSSAWELLVGGILAAQSTDERVNLITDDLFSRYPRIADYAKADQAEIEACIRTVGIFRNKAKAIRGSAQVILEEFGGEVPREMDDLLKLPGVGRKIANLIRGDWYHIPGIVVDTHCGRISRLLGLSDSDQPAHVERDLEEAVPRESWTEWGHLLVTLGREHCRARCRSCLTCPLTTVCTYALQVEVIAELDRAQAAGRKEGCF